MLRRKAFAVYRVSFFWSTILPRQSKTWLTLAARITLFLLVHGTCDVLFAIYLLLSNKCYFPELYVSLYIPSPVAILASYWTQLRRLFSTSCSQLRKRFVSDSETHWPFSFLAAMTLLVCIQRRKCLCPFYPGLEMLLFFLSSSRGISLFSIQCRRYVCCFCANPCCNVTNWPSIQRLNYLPPFYPTRGILAHFLSIQLQSCQLTAFLSNGGTTSILSIQLQSCQLTAFLSNGGTTSILSIQSDETATRVLAARSRVESAS